MNKRLFALLMMLVLVLPVLAACGAEATPTTGTGAAATTAPTAAGAATTAPTMAATTAPMTGTMTDMPMATVPMTDTMTAMPATTTTPMSGTTGTTGGKKMRIALVTDVGKVTDGTFNQFAYEGLKRAEKDLGVEIAFIETVNQSDYEKNLDKFATEKYDLIIGVGFLMGDAVKATAAKYPDLKFAIVDSLVEVPNVKSLLFAEDEAAFLVGALAAQISKSGKIGVVGGIEIPPVKKLVLGYEAGAKYVNPDIQVLQVYIPSFTDPAQGAEAAKNQISEGADVIFGAGGQTGSGGIQAAAEGNVWVIGVDQDEYNTTFKGGPAPKLLTSALKRVDNAVFAVIKDTVDGKFAGGVYTGNAANGGVDYAEKHDADVPAAVTTKVDEIKKGLADGSIKTNVTP